jgi:hypothetical protein
LAQGCCIYRVNRGVGPELVMNANVQPIPPTAPRGTVQIVRPGCCAFFEAPQPGPTAVATCSNDDASSSTPVRSAPPSPGAPRPAIHAAAAGSSATEPPWRSVDPTSSMRMSPKKNLQPTIHGSFRLAPGRGTTADCPSSSRLHPIGSSLTLPSSGAPFASPTDACACAHQSLPGDRPHRRHHLHATLPARLPRYRASEHPHHACGGLTTPRIFTWLRPSWDPTRSSERVWDLTEAGHAVLVRIHVARSLERSSPEEGTPGRNSGCP